MQAFLLEKQAEIADLCRKHHVRSLSVFGSAVRDDFDSERSDVDLLVEFDNVPGSKSFDNKVMLQAELAGLFSRRVDLLSMKHIRNPYLRRSIEQDQRELYAA